MTRRDPSPFRGPPVSADVRVRGVALAALLDSLAPTRRDLGFRCYRAMRRRKLSRSLAADVAARACAAADAGADFASIAAELHVPTNWLTPRVPADGGGRAVASTTPDRSADGWRARALRAEPAPPPTRTPNRREERRR